MLYGPSCCQFKPVEAALTSAACAWARATSAPLTGCAELCLRSRYSSGSAFPYGLSDSGGFTSAEICRTACLGVVDRVRANEDTVNTNSSAPTTSVVVCCRVL